MESARVSLQTPAQTAPQHDSLKPSKKSSIKLVVISIVLIILAMTGVLVFYLNHTRSADETYSVPIEQSGTTLSPTTYENPFESEEEYTNPFEESQNPFDTFDQ
ncbi:hypothetical protein HY469_05895 [Candidatus Roizmanbacteria bacterium]|nr:hypothetical protein [Candidatus Roizmanbacteria bacterium]